MRIKIALLLTTLLQVTNAVAGPLSLDAQPTISVSDVQTVCINEEPFLLANLLINPEDVGRPGILYIGAHDPGQTRAQFYQQHWQAWNGSLFPPHRIAREGLTSTALAIPVGMSALLNEEFSDKAGWKLYMGYGALTPEDEEKVQRAMDGVAKVKAKFPERQFPAVEADHYRRVMIQENMTRNGKYRHVLTWTSDLMVSCETGGGG